MTYKVPFVNYPLQYRSLKKEIDGAIQRVLNKGDLILRSEVEKFENSVAKFLGLKYGIGLNSCTDALFFSLKALGIGRGDEVITVSHTFVATISAIVWAGAKPILVDVGDDFLMDVEKVEAAITKKTKAIIPVHLNGRCCDMKKLMAIAKKYNLVVIEDAAQALGAKFQGKMAGSFGLASCYSFYPAKILGCFGDAGLVCTNNKSLAEKIRLFRDHGQKTKTEIAGYGFNSRLDNLQAAVLNVKFKYLPKWIKRRREIANQYNNGLSEIPEVLLPPAPSFAKDSDGKANTEPQHFDVYQNYVLRVEKRDKLAAYLKKRGVETLIKDPIPNHRQKALKNLHRFNLPKTEQISKQIISLPMYPELTDSQVGYVIETIKKIFKTK